MNYDQMHWYVKMRKWMYDNYSSYAALKHLMNAANSFEEGHELGGKIHLNQGYAMGLVRADNTLRNTLNGAIRFGEERLQSLNRYGRHEILPELHATARKIHRGDILKGLSLLCEIEADQFFGDQGLNDVFGGLILIGRQNHEIKGRKGGIENADWHEAEKMIRKLGIRL